MIRLEVEDYCDSCADFVPDVEHPEELYSGFQVIRAGDTVVRCLSRARCARHICHLQRKLEENAEKNGCVLRRINTALTHEELLMMEGEPVWCAEKDCYCFIDVVGKEILACHEHSELYFGTEGLTFYRHKIERTCK